MKSKSHLSKFDTSQKKKNERTTCGIFYCRDSAKLIGCRSLQTSSWLDNDVLRNRQQKHTAVRYKP